MSQLLYDVATQHGAEAEPTQTSTGTADVKTFTPPRTAVAFLISVETNACRLTLDGDTPDATHGQVFPKDVAPQLVLVGGRDVKVVSIAAANSVVHITWLERRGG